MSGGHFDYKQHVFNDIINELENVIEKNGKENEERGQYGDKYYYEYPLDIIGCFDKARFYLEACEQMVHHIDWLLSGDDGEDTFRENWKNMEEEYLGQI